MRHYIIVIFSIVSLCSCSVKNKDVSGADEDLTAKELLQGIWLDDETDTPLFKIEGDTIYYSDSQNAPVYFKIIKDSLYMYGNEVSHYQIDKQAEHLFWFHSLADNIIKLHKSEEESDSLAFTKTMEVIPTYTEVTKKDTVVMYDGTRYRAYVYINPSKMKVIKTTVSEDGISVDNVFYDNVMHICIYEGRKSLYASDVAKKDFAGVIPDDFLQKSILADMNFIKVNASGYQYQAMLNIPESPLCYIVNLNIGFDGKVTMKCVK